MRVAALTLALLLFIFSLSSIAEAQSDFCNNTPTYSGIQEPITTPIDVRWPQHLRTRTADVISHDATTVLRNGQTTSNDSNTNSVLEISTNTEGTLTTVEFVLSQKAPQPIPPLQVTTVIDHNDGHVISSHVGGKYLDSASESEKMVLAPMVERAAEQMNPVDRNMFIKSGEAFTRYSLENVYGPAVILSGGKLEKLQGPSYGTGFANILIARTVVKSRHALVLRITGKETFLVNLPDSPPKQIGNSANGFVVMDQESHIPLIRDVITTAITEGRGGTCSENTWTATLR
jgi:hypothetical protein